MHHLRCAALALAIFGVSPLAIAADTMKPIVSSAAEGSHVFCASSCILRSLYVTTGAVSGYLMTFNTTTPPADGSLDGTPGHEKPIECLPAAAASMLGIDFGETADVYSTGLTAVFSTTGCFTKTLSGTAFFKGRVQ